MRIKELHLKTWKVIRQADFEELSDFVVVAGPNGVGKTHIKEAIVYIFTNNGNPPPGSKVVLQATTEEEEKAWQTKEIVLPQPLFWGLFSRNEKRLKTKSKLIQIDSNRAVESISFNQLTFQSIGNPEQEDVGYNYGLNNIRDRFKDICNTLQRLKAKEVSSVYNEYKSKIEDDKAEIVLKKLQDPIQKYIEVFGMLLYPKKMMSIDVNSTTIQYKDEDGQIRQFSELSSGEREVVILIFDILTQNPSDCLILIDEPEVHLHPELSFRLIKTLKAVGERNQYFLFTHSTDIIGNALDTGVHFIKPKTKSTANQVIRVDENNLDDLKNIPNIRETIGMISVGKKLLFVEGSNTSIDRNVFATLAKATKTDVAIIPSDSCSNINNMSLVCDTLGKGLFGIDLFMVRDRDGLDAEQISNFTSKSKGRLIFLPFYHIENAFLNPKAIGLVAKKILKDRAPAVNEIESRMINLARQQLLQVATLYVKSEIYFRAGNFDISPKIEINRTTQLADIKSAMVESKSKIIEKYDREFNGAMIESRLNHWHDILESAIKTGWSNEAREYFLGKRILNELQNWLFGRASVLLWEHIIDSEDPDCVDACKELRAILGKV